jgi:Ser-tRNA(Ala) deacylase AlaX
MADTALYRADAYTREADGSVVDQTGTGMVVEPALFYPRGGGQPGDRGWLDWDGGSVEIVDTVKDEAGASVLVPAQGTGLPPVGATVTQRLDWQLRFGHMRIHTALHLLSVVVPLPVTGGGIGAGTGRLDFLMPEPPADRDAIEDALNALIARDLAISEDWITDAELDANPGLVKTMSVAPPRGAGRVRLVRIGQGECQVDLQPCGGTHVARTGEIGRVVITKIANKGKQNRRISIALA